MSIIDRTLERGLPDWSNIRAKQAIVRLADMGELAARLGSIVTFDRRGDVVLLEGFQHGIRAWKVTPTSTGADAYASHLSHRNGGYSLRCVTFTDLDYGVSVTRVVSYQRLSALGFEVSMSPAAADLSGTPDTQELIFGLRSYTGSQLINASFRLLLPAGSLQLLHRDNTYTTVATASALYAGAGVYYSAKVVLDLTNNTYKRALFGHLDLTVSAVSPYVLADTTRPSVLLTIRTVGNASNAVAVYWDDAIVTQNEP